MAVTVDGLPLVPGASGDAVRDLHQRLAAAGFPVENLEIAVFTASTGEALRRFQAHRGLIVDGRCGPDSWTALVEAGYHLGDRLLYLRRPMWRGDDVAELQRRLGALGFDAGRVDGIFGPDTERALKDFQRNLALTTDAVCGPDVLAALDRLGAKANGPANVAGIRERERLGRAPRELAGRRIALADLGGVTDLVQQLAAELQGVGAVLQITTDLDHPAHARAANDFGAELFLGLAASPDASARVAYYSTAGFESIGGHHLAELLRVHCRAHGDLPVVGMRLGLLRETKMPAVVWHLTPSAGAGSEVVSNTSSVMSAPALAPGVPTGSHRAATRAAAAIAAWIETPPG